MENTEKQIKEYKAKVRMYKRCSKGGKSINCSKCIGCASK